MNTTVASIFFAVSAASSPAPGYSRQAATLPTGIGEVTAALLQKNSGIGLGLNVFSTKYDMCSSSVMIESDYARLLQLWRGDQRASFESDYTRSWQRTLQRIDENPINGNGDGVIAPWELDAMDGSK